MPCRHHNLEVTSLVADSVADQDPRPCGRFQPAEVSCVLPYFQGIIQGIIRGLGGRVWRTGEDQLAKMEEVNAQAVISAIARQVSRDCVDTQKH